MTKQKKTGRLLDECDVINALWDLRRSLQMMDNTQRADLILQGVYLSEKKIEQLPSAQPEYEPVKTEDFAKTMSENTLYSFMAWYGEALELMGRQGFVICKKTM